MLEWPGVEGSGRDRSQDMDEVAAVVIEGMLMGDNDLDVENDDDGTSETTNTNSQQQNLNIEAATTIDEMNTAPQRELSPENNPSTASPFLRFPLMRTP